ncbi:MAG: G5 domain-containing protein [Cellulomonadaceae bacterium]
MSRATRARRRSRTPAVLAAGALALVLGLGGGTVAVLRGSEPLPDDAWALDAELPTVPQPQVERVSRGAERSAPGPTLPVTVSLRGEEVETSTQATTVRDLLGELDVVLGEDDAVSHDLDDALEPGMHVTVARVEQLTEVSETAIDYASTEVEDPSLPVGQRAVQTPGSAGTSVTTFLVTYVDGLESTRSEIVSSITAQAQDEVVRVGTGVVATAPPAVSGSGASSSSGSSTGTGSGTGSATATGSGSASAVEASTPVAGSGEGTTPESAKELARSMVAARGWADSEHQCLVSLWQKESRWNYQAANPRSSARGIPQALMSVHFTDPVAAERYLSTPAVQIEWGLSYIAGRYGSPCGAWTHSQNKGWY